MSLHILEVSTSPGVENQHILERNETVTVRNESEGGRLLYNHYHSVGRRAAAFKVMRESGEQQSRFRVPLTIVANIPCYGPGRYVMVWTDNTGFQIVSEPFNLHLDAAPETQDCVVEGIGPFYASVNVESPFRVSLQRWSIRRYKDGEELGSDDHDLDVYFFLGSAGLPLNGLPTKDVHYGPLIRCVIPHLEDVVDKSWPDIESQIMNAVASRLWNLGHQLFCYDKTSGSNSFLNNDWSFRLGGMLEAAFDLSGSTTCNCFDLAALVCAAFKCFGCRADQMTSTESDIFNISTTVVQGVGNMPPGRLFGWQDSTHFADTEPFWRQPIAADQIGSEIDQQTRDEARRQGGMWYVFLGYNNSYQCVPAYPLATPSFFFNPNDPRRTRFGCHCFSVLRNHMGEYKVVDVCVAFPFIDADAGDVVETCLLDDGSIDLAAYLSRGEHGGPQFDASTVQVTNIRVFYVT